MPKAKKLPSPLTILFFVIILAAIATWLMPAGEYNTLSYNKGAFTVTSTKGDTTVDSTVPCTQHTLDSLKILVKLEKFKNGDIFKPVAIPGTYHPLKRSGQGFVPVVTAPIQGLMDSNDIIFFLLFIGGFIMVFQQTGAMEKGVAWLSYKMKGQEAWLIIILSFLFLFCGSAEGMAEEGFAFYPILVPLYLAAGYDLLVPLAVIFAGTSIGNLSSFCNPFSTIIASNASGINWTDGLYERLAIFMVTSIITIWYIVRYAQKVKKNPSLSLVKRIDGDVRSPFNEFETDTNQPVKLSLVDAWLNIQFLATIGIMIYGFVTNWDMSACTAVFLVSAILVAILTRMKESVFIKKFIEGAQSLLSVTMMVGVARGITIVLNNGHVTGTILYYSAGMVSKMPVVAFILVLLLLYMVFTLVISSSSGMAVLTMPIFGSLAVIVGVPGREIVNAYLFGMGIMGLLTPVGLMLPSLAAVNVSLKVWLKFAWPLVIMLIVTCGAFLVFGVMNR
jgi:uncharacterized ion transporter superfamily protein YfcC